jgi:hypothetical protein
MVSKKVKPITLYNLAPLVLLIGLFVAGGTYYYSDRPGELKKVAKEAQEVLGVGSKANLFNNSGSTTKERTRKTIEERSQMRAPTLRNSIRVSFPESQINEMAKQHVVGREAMGYSIVSVEVDLEPGAFTADIEVSDGTEIEVISTPKVDGKGIEVLSIDLESDNLFAQMKESILQTVVQQGVDRALREKAAHLDYLIFGNDEVVVFINPNEME